MALNFDSKRGAAWREILHANRSAVFRDNAITDTQAQTGTFAYRLCRVKRIEYLGRIFHAGTAICKLHEQLLLRAPRGNPEIALSRFFQNRIDRIVDHIQKDLLELMRIGGRHGKIRRKIQMHSNVVHAQIVIAQRQRVFDNLV